MLQYNIIYEYIYVPSERVRVSPSVSDDKGYGGGILTRYIQLPQNGEANAQAFRPVLRKKNNSLSPE
jgi:hypothetical protein